MKKFLAPAFWIFGVFLVLLGAYSFFPAIRLTLRARPVLMAGQTLVDPHIYDNEWFDAARAGRTDILGALLEAHYPVDAKTHAGYTALILSAYDGQPDSLAFLIGKGANACLADNNGNTALMGALYKGEMAIAYSLAQTPCPIDQANNAGETALAFAALFGRIEIIPFLVSHGADPRHRDAQGQTPVVVAAKQGNTSVVNALTAATPSAPRVGAGRGS